jgi:2-aminoadipate transaminase
MATSPGFGRLVPPERQTKTVPPSGLRELLPQVLRPEILSFALGLPATELFPLAECRDAAVRALADPKTLQYNVPSAALKRHIQTLMASRGVACSTEQIFLTAGAQQAIHLLVHLLLSYGRQVLVEELTYEGLHLALQSLEPEILTVPTTPTDGIDLDAVEERLRGGARSAFLYTVPDGHNPLGVSLRPEDRIRLVELARRFHLPVIEDDVYGFLGYDGAACPPLCALDQEWVYYIGSFSKIFAPSLRVGWIVAPASCSTALSHLKHAGDLDISTFSQLTALSYLDSGHLAGHLASLRTEYDRRRRAMLVALEAHFPPVARWHAPSCGMFIWVELPPEIDTCELLRFAIHSEQVAFMPGPIFAIPGQACSRNGIRLNFTHWPPDRMEEGIARLADCLRRFCDPALNQKLRVH